MGLEEVPLPALIEVPSGSFMMGSERISGRRIDAQPVHRVTFSQQFYIAKTEVTFAQYDAFCEATGRSCPPDEEWGRGEQPVINVDWYDARGYVRWLAAMTGETCRLPSEGEWEYAARAGTTTEYALPAPRGSDDIGGKGLANCVGCGSKWDFKQTAPVASFPANAWGVHDMHGNVREWIEDCWHESYQGAPEDGRAWLADKGDHCLRVLRGGSWSSAQEDARSANRHRFSPYYRSSNFGFRVVCSSPYSGTDH